MNPQTFWHLLRFIIILVFPLHFSGCASFGPTKPNLPYAGNSYPAILSELAQTNPLLVKELGKLPELQDGVSETEMSALSDIVELYKSDPANFINAFNEMYKVGLPEYRKYCSPLQALFWLAEDDNLTDDFIVDFSLPKLIGTAWKEKKSIFTHDQALKVINGIRYKDIRNQFLQYIHTGVDEAFMNTIFVKYKNQPGAFSWTARGTIKKALLPDPRWSDIDVVIDRLNAPELLNSYLRGNITYAHHTPCFVRSPDSVLKEKYGDCDDLVFFGKTALGNAGYDVFGRVLGGCQSFADCHVGLGVRLEDGSYLLAVHFMISGNHMSGPYNSLLELDRALGYGTFFHQRDSFNFTWSGICH